MKKSFDIVVLGSGFAGSLIAMIARRLGRSVALIERRNHPRFAIGESSTPLANLLLEEIARRYDLPRLLPLTKWGTWQREHPEIACGLKRGFTFYHHRPGEAYLVDPDRHRQLLVAASPNDEIADTHWFREEFDAFVVNEARALGADYFDETEVVGAQVLDQKVVLTARRRGEETTFEAAFVVDATGPRGLLWRLLQLGETELEDLPGMQSLFTHFRGVKRFDELHPAQGSPPYRPDDAAVHHVFPGGWMWVLRFNNGITSAGVSIEDRLADELNLSEGTAGWQRLLAKFPSLAGQFAEATEVRPFSYQKRLAFCSSQIVGRRWAMLPSAAGFADPMLSTGFPLTLLGVQRLGGLLEESWGGAGFVDELQYYARNTRAELRVTASLIGAVLRQSGEPERFNALTQIYLAAASFSESARRLGRPELAPGFLLSQREGLRGGLEALLARLHPGCAMHQGELEGAVAELIEPVNVAGLMDVRKRNWYPARAEDLLASTAKLDVTLTEVQAMLVRCGFAPSGADVR